jgi:hypothetical protein
MTSSHADSHDLDKLARWHRDLSLNPPNHPLQTGARGDFPVYAVFLVSEADRPAHGIFREFRTRFEAWSAGFDHLVIFGQHGISSTVHGLLNGFGLSLEAVPALVLFSSPLACQAYALPLADAGPGGSSPMNTVPSVGGVLQGPGEDEPSEPTHPATDEPWRYALKLIEAAVDRGEKSVDLASLPWSNRLHLDGVPVVELVAMLLRH